MEAVEGFLSTTLHLLSVVFLFLKDQPGRDPVCCGTLSLAYIAFCKVSQNGSPVWLAEGQHMHVFTHSQQNEAGRSVPHPFLLNADGSFRAGKAELMKMVTSCSEDRVLPHSRKQAFAFLLWSGSLGLSHCVLGCKLVFGSKGLRERSVQSSRVLGGRWDTHILTL